MDSASSALSVASKDGPAVVASTIEDDGSLSVAAELAKEAALLFQSGKYVDCLRILNQLLQQKEDDPKVHHNIVLAENFQVGCPNPKKLIEALEKIKKRTDVLVPTRGEHLNVGGSDEKIRIDHINGTYNVSDQTSRPSPVFSNGIDTVVLFNIAVTWFHLHEYSKSFLCLDALYQNIQPVDEGIALRICLLLLDVALISQNPSRCADVLTYMEKAFCVVSFSNQGDNGSLSQQYFIPNSASITNPGPIPDSSHSDRVLPSNSLENSLSRSLLEEELEDEPLQLLSSLDISGKNLQGRSVISSCNGPTKNQAEDSSSAIDMRLRLHLYKVRLFLLTRNLRAAKREVKMAMNLARGKDNPVAFYLKSELEFARRNYRKAIKLLMASNHTELGNVSMYYNDLGCIYHQLGKYHLSGIFFSKALRNSSLLRKNKPQKFLTISQDKSLLISYNCGLHSLAYGKPDHAARCFRKASVVFYNRPILWLRIAECCLMALEKGLIIPNSIANERFIDVCAIGKGKWRQLSFKSGISPNGKTGNVEKNGSHLGGSKQPDLSLSCARRCLLNALFLLESSEAKFLKSAPKPSSELQEAFLPQRSELSKAIGDDLKDLTLESGPRQSNSNGEVKEQKTTNLAASFQSSISEYERVRLKEIHLMKQAVLADLAYVELALDNPLEAYLRAKSLLELPNCSKIYLFLGNMYAAEALCILNWPMEASGYLITYLSDKDEPELPYTREDCEKWMGEKFVDNEDSNDLESSSSNPATEPQDNRFPSPEEARGILCANYAINMAFFGLLEQAHALAMKALADMPNNTRVIVTAIYLDLKCGKIQDALVKLKQHGAIRFLPIH